MDNILYEFLLLLTPVVGLIITSILIPFIRSKISSEKLQNILFWVEKGVKCAEVIFPDKGMGGTKKEYVIGLINNIFNGKKEVITKEQIEILIESVVHELNKEKM